MSYALNVIIFHSGELHNHNAQFLLEASCMFLPRFGNNLSEDPHSIVVAHVFKVHIVYLMGTQELLSQFPNAFMKK